MTKLFDIQKKKLRHCVTNRDEKCCQGESVTCDIIFVLSNFYKCFRCFIIVSASIASKSTLMLKLKGNKTHFT